MLLTAWIIAHELSPEDFARKLGGVSGSGVRKWMSGERQPDADMCERIFVVTDGAVTAAEMHAVRLAWLKANRPEKFSEAMPVPFMEARA